MTWGSGNCSMQHVLSARLHVWEGRLRVTLETACASVGGSRAGRHDCGLQWAARHCAFQRVVAACQRVRDSTCIASNNVP